MARFDIDLDVDDMINEMSSTEKREMANALYDDGIVPDELSVIENKIPETTTEFELKEILDGIWDNRDNITSFDLFILKKLSNKGMY